jgi:hypothetical protein
MDAEPVNVDDSDDDARWVALAGPAHAVPPGFADDVVALWIARRRRPRLWAALCFFTVVVAALVVVGGINVRQAPQPKTLFVDVDGPPGYVWLDGKLWGSTRPQPGYTRAVLADVKPGEHTLSFVRISPKWADLRPALLGWEGHVVVDADQPTTTVRIDLWRPAERLQVTTEPPGATVLFNGGFQNPTVATAPAGFAAENANSALVSIAVTKLGFRAGERHLRLEPNEERTEHFVLEPATIDDVDVIAPGAIVAANGAFHLGAAPLTVPRRYDPYPVEVTELELRWSCGVREQVLLPLGDGRVRARIEAKDPCPR